MQNVMAMLIVVAALAAPVLALGPDILAQRQPWYRRLAVGSNNCDQSSLTVSALPFAVLCIFSQGANDATQTISVSNPNGDFVGVCNTWGQYCSASSLAPRVCDATSSIDRTANPYIKISNAKCLNAEAPNGRCCMVLTCENAIVPCSGQVLNSYQVSVSGGAVLNPLSSGALAGIIITVLVVVGIASAFARCGACCCGRRGGGDNVGTLYTSSSSGGEGARVHWDGSETVKSAPALVQAPYTLPYPIPVGPPAVDPAMYHPQQYPPQPYPPGQPSQPQYRATL